MLLKTDPVEVLEWSTIIFIAYTPINYKNKKANQEILSKSGYLCCTLQRGANPQELLHTENNIKMKPKV